MTPVALALIAPEHRDVITTGGQVLIALVTGFFAIQVALIQSGRKAAKLAAERSAPTSNGFASTTTETLDEVKESLKAVSRDVAGIRSELRTERTERIRLAEKVDQLLERNPR